MKKWATNKALQETDPSSPREMAAPTPPTEPDPDLCSGPESEPKIGPESEAESEAAVATTTVDR
jgi:hypothetical protein